MAEILHKELSFAVVGAAMEVHRALGPGFLESVYQTALAHELGLRGIPFREQARLSVRYKQILAGEYLADFVIDEKIILEIKAVNALHDAHRAQTVNYLAATGLELGILINFGESRLKYERLVRFKDLKMIKARARPANEA